MPRRGSSIAQNRSRLHTDGAPILSVMTGSMLVSILPVIAITPSLPPLGLLMLLGWRLLRPDLWPLWIAAPLGLFDDVLSGLQFRGESSTASIADPDSGRMMSLRFDRQFRECVVYTPPHREAICIEPLTCAPAAAWLGERGIDAGWRVLAPGESFTAVVAIHLN